jgi:hypothetical protein
MVLKSVNKESNVGINKAKNFKNVIFSSGSSSASEFVLESNEL